MLKGNPLITRFRYSLMRPKQFWIYMTIYIATLTVLFLFNYSGYRDGSLFDTLMEMSASLYFQFLVMQVLVLWLWGSFNSNSAISSEVTDKTYDFFRMLPISAKDKTAGILVGKNLIVLLIAGCNFVFLIAFGLAGKINIKLQAQIIFVLLSAAILANASALLSSINPKGKKGKSGIVVFIALAFFAGPFIISAISALYASKDFESFKGNFYGLQIPVLVLAGLVLLYFSCWAIKGTLRLFTYEDGPLFTRPGAYLFIIGYEIIIVGLFYSALTNKENYFNFNLYIRPINFICWLILLLPVLSIPLGSLHSFDRYLEFAGLFAGRSGKPLNLRNMFLHSNLALGLGLFVIWAIVSVFTTFLAKLPITENLETIGVILSFCLFFLLLIEVYVVITPYTSKIGLLLGFIAAGLAIFPLIFAGVLNFHDLAPHSPLGYLAYMFDNTLRRQGTNLRVAVVNLLLCIIPAFIIFRRYADIIKARRQM